MGKRPLLAVVTNPEPASGLYETTLSTLSAAGQVDTVAGQQALLLARRMSSPRETGASVASLSRRLSSVLAEALENAGESADVVDGIFGTA